jgi:hypothetical protein
MIRLIDLRNGDVLGEVSRTEMQDFLKETLEDEQINNQYVFLNSELIESIDEDRYPSLKLPLSNMALEHLQDMPKDTSYGMLGFEEIESIDDYCIKGRVLDKKEAPLTGLKIEGYDRSFIGKDYLGWCFTNSSGEFSLFFNESDFKPEIPIDLDDNPTVLLRVSRIGEEEEVVFQTDPFQVKSKLFDIGIIEV